MYSSLACNEITTFELYKQLMWFSCISLCVSSWTLPKNKQWKLAWIRLMLSWPPASNWRNRRPSSSTAFCLGFQPFCYLFSTFPSNCSVSVSIAIFVSSLFSNRIRNSGLFPFLLLVFLVILNDFKAKHMGWLTTDTTLVIILVAGTLAGVTAKFRPFFSKDISASLRVLDESVRKTESCFFCKSLSNLRCWRSLVVLEIRWIFKSLNPVNV